MVYRQTVNIDENMAWSWTIAQWQFTPAVYLRDGRYLYKWQTINGNVDWIITLLSDANFRLYSCKITVWGDPYFNFVPCYRKADWEVWVYDLVNDVFYTNQWSWAFKKWPPVNTWHKEITKIYFGGTSS